jgi:hypothetical protein
MKQQTPADKVWTDAKGTTIPYNRTTALERLQERNAHKVLAEAIKAQAALTSLKELIRSKHNEVLSALEKSADVKIKQTKVNKQWYNFDRSIMVEVDAQDRIEFDGLLITAAREKLHDYLTSKLNSDDEFVVEMVTKAFETTNGKLDSKRVMHLVSYKSKVKAGLFQEAIALIEKSIRRTNAKEYFRVSVRQEDGSYTPVQLNFSAI